MTRPLVVLSLTVWTATLQAQAVTGELVDRKTGAPVHGAFVVLLDQNGAEVARALTGVGGTFLLNAPAAGVYRLRSKRIGFRPTESPPFVLTDGQTAGYHLEVEAVPVELPGVVVEGRPQCGMRGDLAAAAAQLWEEASEALAAVKWTEDQGTFHYTVERFQRALPLRGRQVFAEQHYSWSGSGEKPFRAIPAEQLAERGYVVPGPGDSVDYYAPDADVLLGEAFVNTHCFSPRNGGTQRPSQVGLAFEPGPERTLPDVGGVLWLERETLELRFLEFSYTGLRDASLGGHVEFAHLPSGPWIATDWSIRMARMDTVVRRDRRRRQRPPKVLGVREVGGVVSSVSSPTGAAEYWGPLSSLEGTVVDSARGGAPLLGAVVMLVGTDHADTTDDRGHFQIGGALNGEYRVSFRHPRLDSLGVGADERRVTVTRGVRPTLALFVPTERVLVRRLCRDDWRRDRWMIVGVVEDSATATVANAQIRVQVTGKAPETARTNVAGRFVICDVPGARLTISATAGPEGTGEVVLEFREDGVWVDGKRFYNLPGRIWTQDLQLRPPAVPSSPPRAGSPQN